MATPYHLLTAYLRNTKVSKDYKSSQQSSSRLGRNCIRTMLYSARQKPSQRQSLQGNRQAYKHPLAIWKDHSEAGHHMYPYQSFTDEFSICDLTLQETTQGVMDIWEPRKEHRM